MLSGYVMESDGQLTRINLVQPVENPKKWTAETPNLYTVVLQLKNAANETVEAVSCKVGFRQVEIKNRELLINGQPVLMKGVNRHDHDERRGKAVTVESMLADMLTPVSALSETKNVVGIIFPQGLGVLRPFVIRDHRCFKIYLN